MIEVLKQAIDYIENVPDDRDSVGHIDRDALILSLNQTIKKVESQEPVACVQDLEEVRRKHLVYVNGMDWKDPLYTHPPQRTEQNFCSRCGKRTKDLTHIHTCTPPQELI
jgi:hypothetical protein